MDINFKEIKKANNPAIALKPKNLIKKVFITLFILLLLAVVTAGYFFWQWNVLKNKSNDAVALEKENKSLIEAVSKLILLPDEQPTIATVTDPSKLSDQLFFANAQVGYKVLVYSVAKKAILYDPVANKIIEVGPVNVTEESPGTGSGVMTETNKKEQ